MADTDASLNQTGKPAGYTFPNGVVTYVVAGLMPGGTANVVITYPSAIPATPGSSRWTPPGTTSSPVPSSTGTPSP